MLAVGWKVYARLILFNIMLNLVNVICLLVYLRIDNEKSHLWVVHETKDTIRKILFMRVLPYGVDYATRMNLYNLILRMVDPIFSYSIARVPSYLGIR